MGSDSAPMDSKKGVSYKILMTCIAMLPFKICTLRVITALVCMGIEMI
jgi:hypothetical protein